MDVLNAELVTVNTTKGAAYGAAILAGVGVGHLPRVKSACETLIQITDSVTPQSAKIRVFQKMYALNSQLYPRLKSSFMD